MSKRKPGRAAAGKTPMFGLLKRSGKVYIRIIHDTTSKALIPILQRKIESDR